MAAAGSCTFGVVTKPKTPTGANKPHKTSAGPDTPSKGSTSPSKPSKAYAGNGKASQAAASDSKASKSTTGGKAPKPAAGKAPKPAAGKAAGGKAKKAAKTRHKDPEELIHIGITPPNLADDTEAQQLDTRLATPATRPGPIALSKLPWLKQNLAYRAGYHMMTHGLQEHAGHPEIEACNIPGVLVRSTANILNQIADYVLNSGNKIRPGDTMSLTPQDDPFLGVLSFRRIRPGKGGMDHDQDVLRLLFLR